MGIVLVYDSTNPESFSNIRNWLQQIKTHSPPSVAIMLVGNKCDLPHRKISESQGSELARDLDIQFIEASAKNDVNVKELFNKLAEEVIRKGLCLNLNSNTVKLSNKSQKIKGKCCKSK
jgi:small GTP-binding protein